MHPTQTRDERRINLGGMFVDCTINTISHWYWEYWHYDCQSLTGGAGTDNTGMRTDCTGTGTNTGTYVTGGTGTGTD